MPDTFLEHLPELFELFDGFMMAQGADLLKIQVCQTVRQHILGHLHDIANWGAI
jgi:hypothetical protein